MSDTDSQKDTTFSDLLQEVKTIQESNIDPLFWLYADEYRTYSISAAKLLGSVHAAIILSELAQRFKYHRERKELINDEKHGKGWFYHTIDKMEERTALSRKEQDNAINLLERKGLIQKVAFGMPAKRHFRIKEVAILEFFQFSKNHSSLSERDKLDCPKGTNCTYIEEPYKEPKLQEKAAAPIFMKFGDIVKLKEGEYEKLVAEHGKAVIDDIIQTMNDYCAASRPKGYADYAAATRNWIKRKKDNPGGYSNLKPAVDRRTRDMQGNPINNPAEELF